MNGVGNLRDGVAYDDNVGGIHHSNAVCAFYYGVCCDVGVVSPVEEDATQDIVNERVVENGVPSGIA